MKRRSLAYCWLLAVLFAGCEERPVKQPAAGEGVVLAPEPDERLTLSSPRRDYLLGEPVLLDLSLRNTSKEIIKVVEVLVQPDHYQAKVWIAQKGAPFQEFSPDLVIACIWGHRVFPLGPGDSLKYNYRVVCRPRPEFRLAFPKPGDYQVYVVYPLGVAGAKDNGHKPSNVVEVRIKEPVGEDAKVWQQLKDPSFLMLLQLDEQWTNHKEAALEHKEVALKMAELLHAHPKGGYAPALRHSLSKVSPQLRSRLSFEQASRMEEILGIKDFARAEEDPKDKRLDAIRKFPNEQDKTLGDALRSLSKPSGVPLDATPELKAKAIRTPDSVTTLRERMRTLRGAMHASWERRGDGYFLVPFKADTTPDAKKANAEKK